AAIAYIGAKRSTENWITALAFATVAMILRGTHSPGEPWWTAGFSISICLPLAGLSAMSRRRGYVYLAAAAINYAASRVYLWGNEFGQLSALLAVNTIVLALPAIAWLTMDLKLMRENAAGKVAGRVLPFHRIAARISLGLLSVILLFKWLSAVDGGSQSAGVALLNWLALASVVALFVACLWDKD